jgi:hypothetical protein
LLVVNGHWELGMGHGALGPAVRWTGFPAAFASAVIGHWALGIGNWEKGNWEKGN